MHELVMTNDVVFIFNRINAASFLENKMSVAFKD